MSASRVTEVPESRPADALSQAGLSAEGRAPPLNNGAWPSGGLWLAATACLIVLVGFIWAADAITLQGERSVFTVECLGGGWQAKHCDGRLLAGAQYTFRVVDGLREVQFWVVGAPHSTGQLTECAITDGRNWACKSGPDFKRAVTVQMLQGAPVDRLPESGKRLHPISKWRWYLLRIGISLGHDADV